MSILKQVYDVIVVGGGHAGIEAALAAARLKMKVALITLDINHIGHLPCNPSIGGPAKGVVVREIDCLGGEMAKAADKNYLQLKMLNTAKGPGVQCLRAQIDKETYPLYMQSVLKKQKNITLIEDMVVSLMLEDKKCVGVILEISGELKSRSVILTTGTYLEATVLVGFDMVNIGPDNQKSALGLSPQLKNLGFNIIRLKTGTPARIAQNSIDFSKGEPQPGTAAKLSFSYQTKKFVDIDKQKNCFLIHTAPATHQIIRDNLKLSAMYSGNVKGRGPRYCPSIEDKIVRFADKEKHQIFLEPETANGNSIYLQGFSTSMPKNIQEIMVRSLPGLEKAEFLKYAYAIEYDAIYPNQLKLSLETKLIENLYSAGQINGTSGYEEAAVQGLIAGINASLKIKGQNPLILKRSEAYAGLLIDDLISKDLNEPYRLLTSRSEYRLLLRHDNADIRLLKYGYQIGLVSKARYDKFLNKLIDIDLLKKELQNISVLKNAKLLKYLAKNGYIDSDNNQTLFQIIKRPNTELEKAIKLINLSKRYNKEVIEQVEIQIKYEGYLIKQEKEAKNFEKFEAILLPDNIDYRNIANLALEARQKLNEIKPTNVGQASRILGVNPTDINALLIYLKNIKKEGNNGHN